MWFKGANVVHRLFIPFGSTSDTNWPYAFGMKELLRTNDPTIVAFTHALLRAEDIECFDLDVHMSILEGSIGVMPRRVMVADAHYFRACAILRDNEIELPD